MVTEKKNDLLGGQVVVLGDVKVFIFGIIDGSIDDIRDEANLEVRLGVVISVDGLSEV